MQGWGVFEGQRTRWPIRDDPRWTPTRPGERFIFADGQGHTSLRSHIAESLARKYDFPFSLRVPEDAPWEQRRKHHGKVAAALMQLMGEKWRQALAEPCLRGILRGVAGTAQELAQAESPLLVARNEETLKTITDLLHLCGATNALQKSEETKHYIRFLEPTVELTKAIELHFGQGRRLDAELLVIQAP